MSFSLLACLSYISLVLFINLNGAKNSSHAEIPTTSSLGFLVATTVLFSGDAVNADSHASSSLCLKCCDILDYKSERGLATNTAVPHLHDSGLKILHEHQNPQTLKVLFPYYLCTFYLLTITWNT